MDTAHESATTAVTAAAPDAIVRQPAQLNDLPFELKNAIARFCHASDRRLVEYIAELTRRGGLIPPLSLPTVRKENGRSIASLYAVSKKWQTVSLLPQSISASKAHSDLFHLVIGPAYGKYFVEAVLNTADKKGVVELVKALPMLPNLRIFQLEGSNWYRLGPPPPSVQEAVLARLASAVAQGARELAVRYCSLQDILRLTKSAKFLTKFKLQVPDKAVLDNFWRLIKPMHHLTDLLMSSVGFEIEDGSLDLKLLIKTKPLTVPALTVLTLDDVEAFANVADFFGLFAPTLRCVTIKYTKVADPVADQFSALPACCLPQLRRLNLVGRANILLPVLDGIKPTLMPELRHFSVDTPTNDPISPDIVARVKLVAVEFHKLETIVCPPADWVSYPRLAMTPPRVLIQRLGDDATQEERQVTFKYLDDLLAAGQEWRRRAVTTRDWVGLARLAKALQPLDLERSLHEM
ncbi:hypothetical protein JCM10908_000497 [Rhodotorula pacifica]|uniref:uncharacterized protein n=1 Tax=Rhodotorula pacifica TaxID=1495444 RepID=UPI00317F0E53